MYNFIHVPKAAGSSFKTIIDAHLDVLLYSGHTKITDIKSFAFVRHPYDRLLSAYFYLINGGGQTELDLSYQELLKPYGDFKTFVLNIEKDNLLEILHIRPMHYYLCDNGKIVDMIFKIEDIASIDNFLLNLGIEEKLSDIFVNITYHDHYTEYLDKEVISEINRIYKEDFDVFGYKRL